VAISIYAPARDAVRTLLRRIVGRRALDPMTTVARFADLAAGKSSAEVPTVLAGFVTDLYAPRACAWLRAGEGHDALLAALTGRRGAVAVWEEPSLRAFTAGLDEVLVLVPIHRGPDVVAALALGALPGRRFYGRDDIALLSTLVREAEIFLENARLFDDIVERTRASVERDATHLAEREAILRELHDGLGGIATGISLLAEAGRRAGSPEGAARTLATISELAREHVSEIRGFMQDLEIRPTSWRVVARDVEMLCRRLTQPQGLALAFSAHVGPSSPPPDALVDFHLRRIVKEACINTIKHAEAKRLRVELTVHARELTLVVADDGCGVGVKPTASDGGHGLGNMRQRAESLGGAIRIGAALEGGTELCLTLPLAPPSSTQMPVRIAQLPPEA
jgi:signal transduction histidine kinase